MFSFGCFFIHTYCNCHGNSIGHQRFYKSNSQLWCFLLAKQINSQISTQSDDFLSSDMIVLFQTKSLSVPRAFFESFDFKHSLVLLFLFCFFNLFFTFHFLLWSDWQIFVSSTRSHWWGWSLPWPWDAIIWLRPSHCSGYVSFFFLLPTLLFDVFHFFIHYSTKAMNMERLRKPLSEMVDSLFPHVSFNIIGYGGSAFSRLFDAPAPPITANKEEAKNFIGRLREPQGPAHDMQTPLKEEISRFKQPRQLIFFTDRRKCFPMEIVQLLQF